MSTFDFSSLGGLGTVSTPAAPSTFSFGSSFGTPSTTTPTSAGGLFGGTAATPASGTGGSLFGGTSAGTTGGGFSLFGASTPATSTGTGSSLFGSSTPSTSGSLFGGTATSLGVDAGSSSSLWSTVPATSSGGVGGGGGGGDGMRGQPQEAIRAYGMCWSKETPACRFNHAFYNVVHPGEVAKYTRPPNVDERSWALAVQQNPDPQRMVPVFAKGFEDLKKRVDEQDAAIKEHEATLQNAHKLTSAIHHKHQVGTLVKMEAYKRRNMELAGRVLRVMKKVETLRAMGIPTVPSELDFRARLQKLRANLNEPNKFKSILNEMSSLVRMQDEMQDLNYDVIDEENMEKIFQVLQQQQEGLVRLTEIVTRDLQDLYLMVNNAPALGL